jgi:hypothetical protein
MINVEFKSHLGAVGAKNDDGEVNFHFVLVYELTGYPQEFLVNLDTECKTNTMVNFDNPEWKSIVLDVPISNIFLTFNKLEIKCNLVQIKVSRSEKKGLAVYKYCLEFKKAQTVDGSDYMLIELLNRKDPDKEGKMVLNKYPTFIKKMF